MDKDIINNIKTLGIDMINEAKSGHPGIVLGAAPMLYTLYSKHLNINVNDENWINRDRFILSAGHGSALLYATLFMAGYLEIEDLKKFRKINSKTPGHPEIGITPGVDMQTGPLGQGIASAVGMAIAEKKLQDETVLSNKKSLIDHKIYVLCGDGDLMEGISYEACSLAGTLNLNNLIVLYDSNDVCLDGNTNMTFNEDILGRFKAMGWDTIFVKNGNYIADVDKAISAAKKNNKPTLIQVKTVIGDGSLLAGTNKVHGKFLTPDDTAQLKEKLGMPNSPFFVNEQARTEFKRNIANRTAKKYEEWGLNYRLFEGEIQIDQDKKLVLKDEMEYNLLMHDFYLSQDSKEAMRVTNKKIMNEIAKIVPNFFGGSADLASATNTYLDEFGDFSKINLKGRNIWFGIREHAMAAILNGISMYNYRVFGSTFLSFSDYMKPSLRLAALMKRPINYVFTHDSISVGEDGPTHQPVEQLVSLRSIPNFNVFRPADAKEIIGCWNVMINSKTTPNAIIISRNEVPILDMSSASNVANGGYIIEKERGPLNGIIIATGTEVHNAIHIARDLYAKYQINVRVVSMPSREIFERMPESYQEEILPKGYKKFVIEAGSKLGWEHFVYNNNYLFTVDMFGASGSKDDVYKYCHFDYETIENSILKLIR